MRKDYPGGFRLTKKTAQALAVQEFGTARGLEKDPTTDLEGYFRMEMGNLCISIRPDIGMSSCIEVAVHLNTANYRCVGYFNRETLEPDFNVMERYRQEERREILEQLVYSNGPDSCHKLIDEIWNEGEK